MGKNGKSEVVEVEQALLDMPGAGRYLAHSPWWVRRKIYAGELGAVKFGGKLMVEKKELDRFIARHRIEASR